MGRALGLFILIVGLGLVIMAGFRSEVAQMSVAGPVSKDTPVLGSGGAPGDANQTINPLDRLRSASRPGKIVTKADTAGRVTAKPPVRQTVSPGILESARGDAVSERPTSQVLDLTNESSRGPAIKAGIPAIVSPAWPQQPRVAATPSQPSTPPLTQGAIADQASVQGMSRAAAPVLPRSMPLPPAAGREPPHQAPHTVPAVGALSEVAAPAPLERPAPEAAQKFAQQYGSPVYLGQRHGGTEGAPAARPASAPAKVRQPDGRKFWARTEQDGS